jgi:hypothetical protein
MRDSDIERSWNDPLWRKAAIPPLRPVRARYEIEMISSF